MAVRDIVSNLQATAILAIVGGNGTLETTSVDTSKFEEGFSLFPACVSYTDGTHTVTLQESEDDSVWADVESENYILSLSDIDAVIDDGDIMDKVGIFGTKRYIRAKVVSVGVTSGAVILFVAVQKAEALPVA